MKEYHPDQMRVAHELANTLQDTKSLKYYLSLTRRLSERALKETLAEVMAKDEKEIWKSRAAYFVYLINHKYGNNNLRA